MTAIQINWRQHSVDWLSRYPIPLGMFFLLTGLLWLPSSSSYHTSFYGFVAAPTFIALCLRPSLARDISRTPIVALFLLFSLWALASLTWGDSSDKTSSLLKRPLYIGLLFAGCCLVAQQSNEGLIKSVKISALAMLPLTLYCLYVFMSDPNSPARLVGSGSLDNPLLSSHVFGFFASFWLAAAITLNKRHTLPALIAAAVMLLAMMSTESRTSLVAISLTAIWLMLCTSKLRALLLLAGLIMAGSALLYFAPEIIINRGTSYRLELWQATLEKIAHAPLIGHGFSAELHYPNITNRILEEPHNFALNVWYDVGLIGLSLWAAMYSAALLACWKWRHDRNILIASALLVYGIGAGLTEGGGILPRPKEHWFVIWIPLSIVAALIYSKKKTA